MVGGGRGHMADVYVVHTHLHTYMQTRVCVCVQMCVCVCVGVCMYVSVYCPFTTFYSLAEIVVQLRSVISRNELPPPIDTTPRAQLDALLEIRGVACVGGGEGFILIHFLLRSPHLPHCPLFPLSDSTYLRRMG